jgi:hypothetical protein
MDQRMLRIALKIALTYTGKIFFDAKSAAGMDMAKPMLEPIRAISSVSIIE